MQFDPPALIASIDRMMEKSPQNMYLTHFGRVQNVAHLAEKMKAGVLQFVQFADRYGGAGDRTAQIENAMMEWLLEGIREHGVMLAEDDIRDIVQNDVVLNTQGIEYWIDPR